MARCAFVDPANGQRSVWSANYRTEEVSVRRREVATMEPTASGWKDVAPVQMQGATQPRSRQFTGTADDALHLVMLKFYQLSASQTVIFEDFTGERFQVIVVGYEPTRNRAMKARGNANHSRDYKLDIEIVATAA